MIDDERYNAEIPAEPAPATVRADNRAEKRKLRSLQVVVSFE
jgi:hypothetical protein